MDRIFIVSSYNDIVKIPKKSKKRAKKSQKEPKRAKKSQNIKKYAKKSQISEF